VRNADDVCGQGCFIVRRLRCGGNLGPLAPAMRMLKWVIVKTLLFAARHELVVLRRLALALMKTRGVPLAVLVIIRFLSSPSFFFSLTS